MARTEMDIRRILLEDEEKLSPFARRSSESLGRQQPMRQDPFRLEFARDETRIIHSPPFRRLKHKTQVFLSPSNDHICTRMEHVLHVSSIASVIGRCLNLNVDLINAIAKAHDLGHPPFGHGGERTLDEIARAEGCKDGFVHEVHGLRVVDVLTNHGAGLNLTYEVRDGVVSHCGERFQRAVKPDRQRDLRRLGSITSLGPRPSTLEGCLVRMVDPVAYLGRDLEDGIKAGLVRKSDVPGKVSRNLGTDNGRIIGRLVHDVIANSIDRDAVALSEDVFGYMRMLRDFNYERIYRHPQVEARSRKADHVLRQLFGEFMTMFDRSDRGQDGDYAQSRSKEAPCANVFFDFVKNTSYTDKVPAWRVVTDFVAGMTDVFAERCYEQLFLPAPLV